MIIQRTFVVALIAFTMGSIVPTSAATQAEALGTVISGMNLTAQDAKKLEQKLMSNPDDVSTRTRLLGYYNQMQRAARYDLGTKMGKLLSRVHRPLRLLDARKFVESLQAIDKQDDTSAIDKACERHILWLIQHHPAAPVLSTPFVAVSRDLEPAAYGAERAAWLAQVERYSSNPVVLANAATFMAAGAYPDPQNLQLTQNLLRRAEALEPKNQGWPEQLAAFYFHRMEITTGAVQRKAAQIALAEYERVFVLLPDLSDRLPYLDDAADAAFEAGRLDKAWSYACQALRHARSAGPGDWYHGDAIHFGNLTLGRMALREGHVAEADRYLLAAGRTPGSGWLNSAGPNMSLAKELLEKGQKQVVLEYFELCSRFWKDKDLTSWASDVRHGTIPDFGANGREWE